jgi:hypothetical protein
MNLKKDNMVYIPNGLLFDNKKELHYVISRTMNGPRDHDIKQNKPESERQISQFPSYVDKKT